MDHIDRPLPLAPPGMAERDVFGDNYDIGCCNQWFWCLGVGIPRIHASIVRVRCILSSNDGLVFPFFELRACVFMLSSVRCFFICCGARVGLRCFFSSVWRAGREELDEHGRRSVSQCCGSCRIFFCHVCNIQGTKEEFPLKNRTCFFVS